MKTFSAILALANLAAAVPTSSKSYCTKYTDTYDDLTANLLLPQLSPVGTYHGLSYGAFVVSQPAGVSGIIPKSSPNVAAATMAEDLLQLGSVSLNPFGTISSATGKSFDLSSFYFGCVLDSHTSLVAPTVGCTIAVTGYTRDNVQVPEQTFAFAPTAVTGVQLNFAAFPAEYSKLVNVTIGIVANDVANTQTVLILDNLVHCNW